MLRSKITQYSTLVFTFLFAPSAGILAAIEAPGISAIYLEIPDGDNFQAIEGEATLQNHEGKIEVLSWSWGIEIADDAATGLPTGKRELSDLSIEKYIDKATPLLLHALQYNMLLPEVIIEVIRINPDGGSDYLSLVITLTNAQITSVELGESADPGAQLSELVSFHFEEAHFAYTPLSGIGPFEVHIDNAP